MERVEMVQGAPVGLRSADPGRFGEALRNAEHAASSAPEPGEPLSGPPGVEPEWQSMNLRYLEIQATMQRQSQQFAALSNVMKVKHETAKAIIQNVH